MRSNLDLLMAEMGKHTIRAHALQDEARALARDAGELQAMAMAVSEEIRLDGTPNAASIPEKQCPNRYAHKSHLWRDEDYGKAVWPTCRCSGRSTDAT
jgi:hypothetical protein